MNEIKFEDAEDGQYKKMKELAMVSLPHGCGIVGSCCFAGLVVYEPVMWSRGTLSGGCRAYVVAFLGLFVLVVV
jgi:hypothetical protein